MHFSSIAILTATFASFVIGIEPPSPGYSVETLQWEVHIAPGRTEILNGTVQKVYKQALQINPEFKLGPQARDQVLLPPPPQKRSSVNCGTWAIANKIGVQDGINYLRGVGGAPRNGPGPGNCGRVSCSNGAAIWWCNDNTTPKTLDNWDLIADSAQYIVNVCAPSANQVSGQNFESDNWNTIVRGEEC